jgi:hypothetical protein
MIKIDLDKLTESELIELNHKIVIHLQLLNQKRKYEQMLEFKIGERVSFQPDGYDLKIGILTRYNKKTVTIITEDGEHWNVSPSLIQKVKTSDTVRVEEKNVVQLFKK